MARYCPDCKVEHDGSCDGVTVVTVDPSFYDQPVECNCLRCFCGGVDKAIAERNKLRDFVLQLDAAMNAKGVPIVAQSIYDAIKRRHSIDPESLGGGK